MKIGLVLSGGGARGLSHLGVVKALLERGIRPQLISGTSSGALVGGLLAYGYPPDEILELFIKTRFLQHVRPAFGGGGLLRLDRLETIYRTYIPENTFEVLSTPLVVAATDLVAGEVIYFRAGELARPVLASCCIPGLFEPMLFQGRQLVDGGVLDNLPVEPIRAEVDYVIGVHCNPFTRQGSLKSTRDILMRSLILAVQTKTKDRFDQCDLLIEAPQLCDYTLFDLRKARELFALGYRHARQVLAQVPYPLET